MNRTNDEGLTLRVTVINGKRCGDDFIVLWRGLTIGRIMLGSGAPSGRPQWTWSCYLGGMPTRGGENGTGMGFGDCKRQFREAWERIRAGLTDEDITRARKNALTRSCIERKNGLTLAWTNKHPKYAQLLSHEIANASV